MVNFKSLTCALAIAGLASSQSLSATPAPPSGTPTGPPRSGIAKGSGRPFPSGPRPTDLPVIPSGAARPSDQSPPASPPTDFPMMPSGITPTGQPPSGTPPPRPSDSTLKPVTSNIARRQDTSRPPRPSGAKPTGPPPSNLPKPTGNPPSEHPSGMPPANAPSNLVRREDSSHEAPTRTPPPKPTNAEFSGPPPSDMPKPTGPPPSDMPKPTGPPPSGTPPARLTGIARRQQSRRPRPSNAPSGAPLSNLPKPTGPPPSGTLRGPAPTAQAIPNGFVTSRRG